MNICICSSLSFYDEFSRLKVELEQLGHRIVAPELDFDTTKIDVSQTTHTAWKNKGEAIKSHFAQIDTSDCVLITNYTKGDVPDYIGANAFLEMGHAFSIGKRIFLLNKLPLQSTFIEEILAMQPIVLEGDISNLK